MSGYPVIYWVVVAIVAGAVSTVLLGIGYLLGRKMERRAALAGLRVLEHSVDRLKGVVGNPAAVRVVR